MLRPMTDKYDYTMDCVLQPSQSLRLITRLLSVPYSTKSLESSQNPGHNGAASITVSLNTITHTCTAY